MRARALDIVCALTSALLAVFVAPNLPGWTQLVFWGLCVVFLGTAAFGPDR